jgi:hypothetical protein
MEVVVDVLVFVFIRIGACLFVCVCVFVRAFVYVYVCVLCVFCVCMCVWVCVCVRTSNTYVIHNANVSVDRLIRRSPFTPVCFTPFCFTPPCHFTPLLDIRSLTLDLTPFGWLHTVTLSPFLNGKNIFDFRSFFEEHNTTRA